MDYENWDHWKRELEERETIRNVLIWGAVMLVVDAIFLVLHTHPF